ncbi:MAG: DUF896 domain-containing protein [Ruminiclostridium sp.]|nr:DUF896 domain-containing protein [Ruminiclostridium sp.]
MDKKKIERINFLARKSKTEPLSDDEKAEQTALRNEYREYMRNGYMAEFSNTYIVDENGSKRKLIKNE